MSDRRAFQRPANLREWPIRSRAANRSATTAARSTTFRRTVAPISEPVDLRTTPFRTGRWTIEPARHVARSPEGEERRLGPRGTALLVLLAGSEGRVLEKNELLDVVWEGQFVSENALSVAIYELRRTLGDRASDPEYIETIHGRGYRWIPEVLPVRRRAAGRSSLGGFEARTPSRTPEADVEALRRRVEQLEVENARLLALLREGA